MNVWESNHDARNIAEVYIFRYWYAKRRAAFIYSIPKSKSPCVLLLRYYLQHKSFAVKSFKENFCKSISFQMCFQIYYTQLIPGYISLRKMKDLLVFFKLKF